MSYLPAFPHQHPFAFEVTKTEQRRIMTTFWDHYIVSIRPLTVSVVLECHPVRKQCGRHFKQAIPMSLLGISSWGARKAVMESIPLLSPYKTETFRFSHRLLDNLSTRDSLHLDDSVFQFPCFHLFFKLSHASVVLLTCKLLSSAMEIDFLQFIK